MCFSSNNKEQSNINIEQKIENETFYMYINVI